MATASNVLFLPGLTMHDALYALEPEQFIMLTAAVLKASRQHKLSPVKLSAHLAVESMHVKIAYKEASAHWGSNVTAA